MNKFLKIIGLGLVIWSLALVWPEINLTLILAVVVAAVVVLGIVALLTIWQQNSHQNSTPPPKQRHQTRPIAVH